PFSLLFSFADPATPDLYPLSLHDALPISPFIVRTDWAQFRDTERHKGADRFENQLNPSNVSDLDVRWVTATGDSVHSSPAVAGGDRKSTRLNSSHVSISYAVFCLKKKNPR